MAADALSPPLTFLCVGAPKTATTSLHYALKAHPQIHMPFGKEVELREPGDRLSVSGWRRILRERYALDLHRPPPGGRRMGLVNPRFWMDPSFAAYLRNSFPEIRILVVLRDPADRLISHYLEHLQRDELPLSFPHFLEEAFDPDRLNAVFDPALRIHSGNVFAHLPALIARASLYARVLGEYLAHFPREQIHIVVFERLIRQPETTLHPLLRFLGVEPRPLPLGRRHSREVTRRPWMRWWADLVLRVGLGMQRFWPVRKAVKWTLGRRVYDVWYWLEEHRRRARDPGMTHTEMRRLLLPRLREDVQTLFSLIGPIPEWKDWDV